MAQVHKAFAVSVTAVAATTLYSVPASTIAKVQITGMQVKGPFASLNIGVVSYSSSGSSGANVVYQGGGVADSTTLEIAAGPPLTIYLGAGQTISYSAGSNSTVKAQILVTEVPA